MIVMINGSFGVGKTTVAKLLSDALPWSAVYDPEIVGSVLMRLPNWIKLKGSGTDDFQDIDLWRNSVVAGAWLSRFLVPGPVIVPMTFSRRDYFDEVVTGIKRFEPDLRVFCLMASLPTIKERLVGRGTKVEGKGTVWLARRITECVNIHREHHFGEWVDTESRSARKVAINIVERLQQPSATTPNRMFGREEQL